VVTKYDEGVFEGQLVFAVIPVALLGRCCGPHDVDKERFVCPDVTSY
jgi:hypothetical protein